ncbi:hypothetical protein ABIE65_005283 [Constrictibacter sp. MBR-5]|jgi:hypothetical protein
MEASAAPRTIMRRASGETYREMLERMAVQSGIATPSAEDLVRLDRKGKGKKFSNKDWESPTEIWARGSRARRTARRTSPTSRITRWTWTPARSDLEVGRLTGAGYGKKSADRLAQRHGYCERDWEPRAGTVELRIPKLRTGSYFPGFLEPRRIADRSLTSVIQEAYIQGISTRSVDDLVKSLGMSGIP